MSYTISNGIIHTTTCEVNIVHHCNLACQSCSHLSPVLSRHIAEASQIFNDLSNLAKYYHATQVRIIGGEPLLHPNLIDIIDAVRASRISDTIRIATNGILLPRMPETFWQRVDEVAISVYPGKELSEQQIAHCHTQADIYGVKLQIFLFDRFRVSYSEFGTHDSTLVARIYRTCLVAHHWRCHTIQDGYFYRCPQSLFLPRVLNDAITPATVDGIKIVDTPDFQEQLLAYLESLAPLHSCSYCLGSAGRLFPHGQVARKDWRNLQQAPTEALLDEPFLAALEEAGKEIDTLCIRKPYESPSIALLPL